MVNWKKLNKKVAGVLLGVMVLFSASTTAFAYGGSVGRDGKYRSSTDGDGAERRNRKAGR